MSANGLGEMSANAAPFVPKWKPMSANAAPFMMPMRANAPPFVMPMRANAPEYVPGAGGAAPGLPSLSRPLEAPWPGAETEAKYSQGGRKKRRSHKTKKHRKTKRRSHRSRK